MKQVWVTSLDRDPAAVGIVLAIARQYGLAADGHFWTDDLAKIAWKGPLDRIANPAVAVWIIIGGVRPVSVSVGFGLTLLALSAARQRERGPVVVWLDRTAAMTAAQLPTPLQSSMILPLTSPALGAKLVAAANTPSVAPEPAPYRLAVHAHEGYGTWLEVGPAAASWAGSLVGVAPEGQIVFQGVGPAGQLPQKAVLAYPEQGLHLRLGETEYIAWAVRNLITATDSHYVKIDGAPGSLVFGPHASDDDAEVFVLRTSCAA
jgi:hypothetical protein